MKRLFSDPRVFTYLGIAAVIGVAAFFVTKGNGDYTFTELLSNGFFAGGLIVLGIGGLIFCRNGGTFDTLGYGISRVGNVHWPWLRREEMRRSSETIHEYRERKAQSRTSPLPAVAAGLIFIVLAVLFLII